MPTSQSYSVSNIIRQFRPARLGEFIFAKWSTDERTNNLNFFRLLLAITVIFSHAYITSSSTGLLDPLGRALHNHFDNVADHAIDTGHLAVDAFFVISGYLISMSWHRRPNLGSFFKKRILRIYPGFIVAMAFCVLFFGPLGSQNPGAYWSSVKSSVVGLTINTLNLTVDWSKPPFTQTLSDVPLVHCVDGSMWTIRYEFLCYVMVAVLGVSVRFLNRRISHRLMRLAPAIFLSGAYILYAGLLNRHFGRWSHLDNHKITAWIFGGANNLPRLVTYFAVGICFYAYRRVVRFSIPRVGMALAILILSALAPPALALLLPVLGSYVLLAIGFAPWLGLSTVGVKNDLSYGIYLYAFPIQQLMVLYFSNYLVPLTAFVAATLLTLPFAWMSWVLVEKPALRLKRPFPLNSVPPAAQGAV